MAGSRDVVAEGTGWIGACRRNKLTSIRCRKTQRVRQDLLVKMLTETRIIDEFVQRPCAPTMDAVISRFRRADLSDETVAYLAAKLSQSGFVLEHLGSRITADVPSTGGPSSLSTLLCPLQLASAGAAVPKLGVPGRPAGGIDVLACIPGYKVNLDPSRVKSCLDECGYSHFLAGQNFAPLDAMLFSYRKQVGALAVGPLAIASLMAKKLAVGIRRVALDVRVAPFANFGSWDAARMHARRFVSVSTHLGIESRCVLTDATIPYQGFIGRGEALVALRALLQGGGSGDLLLHAGLCKVMAETCLQQRIEGDWPRLRALFCKHLEQQGATWAAFEEKATNVQSQPRSEITASSEGFVRVDLDLLRSALTREQDNCTTFDDPFPDPSGVVLTTDAGCRVQRGEVIAIVRAKGDPNAVASMVSRGLQIVDQPVRRRNPEIV